MECKRFHAELFADRGDFIGQFGEARDVGFGAGAVVAVLAVIEQAPCARGGDVQGGDQRFAVIVFKFGAAAFEPFEAICAGDEVLLWLRHACGAIIPAALLRMVKHCKAD